METRFVILLIAIILLILVLLLGFVSFIKGGEFAKKYSNRLMFLRVTIQGIILILLFLMFAKS